MRLTTLLLTLLCSTVIPPTVSLGRSTSKPPGKDAILLSNVQTLTLRGGNRLTTSRRVSPVPQLKCVGPSQRVCDLCPIETMRCTNAGYDYDTEDVQWTCTAQLPEEFKLGATDVVCEGYRNADDKWVLKGSCGVEYRLLLTDKGEERFGKVYDGEGKSWNGLWMGRGAGGGGGWRRLFAKLGDLIFFGFMVAVFVMIIVPMIRDCLGFARNRRTRPAGPGWGGFWGGGGGGGGGGGDGGGGGHDYSSPPPPYSSSPPPKPSSQGWSPGFWSGLLGGAAAGYHMGRRNRQTPYEPPYRGWRPASPPYRRYDDYDPGEGSSRSRPSPSFSSTSTSTGFGSTRRR